MQTTLAEAALLLGTSPRAAPIRPSPQHAFDAYLTSRRVVDVYGGDSQTLRTWATNRSHQLIGYTDDLGGLADDFLFNLGDDGGLSHRDPDSPIRTALYLLDASQDLAELQAAPAAVA